MNAEKNVASFRQHPHLATNLNNEEVGSKRTFWKIYLHCCTFLDL